HRSARPETGAQVRVAGPAWLCSDQSDIETEMQDIAFLDDVILAFQAQPTRFLGTRLATILDEVVIGDGFSTNEATLEVGVDDRSRLRRGCADTDLPGTDFLHPGGEIGLQAEQLVTGADHAVQARLVESHV